ncbi:MAG: TonB-dependent receptor [Chromatocurvus sp.]
MQNKQAVRACALRTFSSARFTPTPIALALFTMTGLTVPGVVSAQGGSAQLEEVVVSARKRTESLQDVPVAVTALSAGMIERGNINSIVDVKKLAPNVEMVEQPFAGAALSASIRGIGLDDLEKTFEPTVAVSVDGVFLASSAGANVDLFDVESIEILRGPQGTIFGRNTIGGVINITRSKPTGEFGVRAEATLDEFNRQDYKAIVNMPLGDKGGIKIGARSLTSDAFTDNVTRNENNPDNRDLRSSTVSVLYEFTENFTAQFTWDNYNDNTRLVDQLNISSRGNDPASPNFNPADAPFQGANDFALIAPAFGAPASGDPSAASDFTTTYSGGQFISAIQGNNYTLQLDGVVANHDVKFITARSDTRETMDICSWGSPKEGSLFPFGTGTAENPADQPCFFPVLREQEFEQASSELQINSSLSGPLNYVAGLYYLTSEAPFVTGPIQIIESNQDLTARAIYAEFTYEFNEKWGVTAGARYTDEEKKFFVQTPSGDFSNGSNFRFEDDEVTYRVILERELDFGMAYTSYSTGFRSGGFNARGNTPNTVGPFGSETVDTFELGIRTEWLDNRLTFNATFFDSVYKDKQEQVVTAGDGSFLFNGQPEDCNGPTCTFIFNAGEVETRGIELESMALLTDALTIRASLGTLDADYSRFDHPTVGDISDRAQVTYAPELTYNIGAEYIVQALGGEVILNGNFKYTDDSWGRTDFATYDFQYGPDIIIDSFKVLDLSATFRQSLGDGMFTARLYGTDLLEDGGRIARPFDAGAFAFAALVPRRTVGVTFGYEF